MYTTAHFCELTRNFQLHAASAARINSRAFNLVLRRGAWNRLKNIEVGVSGEAHPPPLNRVGEDPETAGDDLRHPPARELAEKLAHAPADVPQA